ncbi:MAG TPA: universal stress protein [Micromonosporaceae bacterium]|nr:universal stress protein [Micromonosporaceae bacterium]
MSGSVHLVEEYGPSWSPGPYELGTDGPRLVLVGVDGSPTSLRAAAFAAGLARRQGSRLAVVYVATPSMWTGIGTVPMSAVQEQLFNELIDDLRRQIRERVDEIAVPVTFMVRRGDAFNELRDAATDMKADSVVVGASEQSGHRLIGSVAVRLVRVGRWPVTVVP